MKNYPVFLTIAGSDPSGGAGIQCDVKVATQMGVYATAVMTTLTSQNTSGVADCYIVPSEVLRSQLSVLLDDIRPDAVKIGMLPSVESIRVVADVISKYNLQNVVVDPILSLTKGNSQIKERQDFINCLAKELFPKASLVTPNLPELDMFLSELNESDCSASSDYHDVLDVLGCDALLLKGGHGDYKINGKDVVIDKLISRNSEIVEFVFPKLQTSNSHGTGCFLSTAIACGLALHKNMTDSVAAAEDLLHKALEFGAEYSFGKGDYGPLNFFVR